MSGSSPQVQLNKSGTTNGAIPSTAKIYSFTLNLTSGVSASIDLRSQQYSNILSDAQGMFIDNSANTAPLSVAFPTGQTVIIAGNNQAMMPVYLASSTPVFTLSGSGSVGIVLTNFPTPAATWNTKASGFVVTNGLLQVQDPAVEALIINSALSTSDALYTTGDTILHARAGIAHTGSITAVGTTTVLAGSPNCFLTGYRITLDPNATCAAQTDLTVTTQFINAGVVSNDTVQVGTVAASGTAAQIVVAQVTGLDLLGSASGDSLEIVMAGAALATGALRYTLFCGTTGLQ